MQPEDYDYSFSKKLIARLPASPRDSARLLVYNRKTNEVFFDTFLNVPVYLPRNAVLVFNETKVVPARLTVKKETGGKAVLLYIESKNGLLKFLSDRKLSIGSKLYAGKKFFTVQAQEEKLYVCAPSFPAEAIFEVLEKNGQTPLPPYIKNSPLSESQRKEKYQTVFARRQGSVAAPTASLHFTTRLLKKLARAGIETHFITLHVNLGTFAPLTQKNIAQKRLHKEYFEISPSTAAALNKAKKEGRPIIAVGTTVVRTLESAATRGQLQKLNGQTDLFITEDYRLNFVDGLITNFHVPRSSLLMLVSALTGREKLLKIYKKAVNKKFRLFSFGDGMLIL